MCLYLKYMTTNQTVHDASQNAIATDRTSTSY